MKIRFIKNIQFTKLVKANGRLKEFNFRKLKGAEEELFTVDVSDERGNRIIFSMAKEDNQWKLVEKDLPSWVIENESKFNELIEEELRNTV